MAQQALLTRGVEQATDLLQVSLDAAAQRIQADRALVFSAFRKFHLARSLMRAQR